MPDEMPEQAVVSWIGSIQGCVARDNVWEGSEPLISVAVFFLTTRAKIERLVFKPILYVLSSGEVDKRELAPCFSNLLADISVD